MRPPSSTARNCLKPRPRGPSRFSSGTRQSAKLSGRVSDAFHPILRYGSPGSNPGVPLGTIRLETSLRSGGAVAERSVALDWARVAVYTVRQAIPELLLSALDREFVVSGITLSICE